MFKALPTWYRACEGMVQVVTDALADADRVAAQVGLKLKPVGAATSAAARKPR
jgi:hypothetical protein